MEAPPQPPPRAPHSRSRRRVLRLALYITLGLATTFVVAAALAARVRFLDGLDDRWGERLIGPGGVPAVDSGGKAPPNTMYFEMHANDEFGVTFAYSRLRAFGNYTPAAPPPVNPTPESVTRRWERSRLTPWVTGDRPWPSDNKQEHKLHAKASGWPLRCFWCEVYGHNIAAPTSGFNHDYVVHGGLAFGNTPKPGWADWPPDYPIIIPLRPIDPELALNTAFYAVAWWLLLTAPGAVRRFRRHRRGACEGCGYDRRGLAPDALCPECATPSPGRRT